MAVSKNTKKQKTSFEEKIKSVSLFDHVNATLTAGSSYFDNLSDGDRSSWNSYMVNRFISMNPDYVEVIASVQKYSPQLSPAIYFKLLQDILPRRKCYNRYIKSSTDKYDSKLIELLCREFEASSKQVKEYLKILTKENVKVILQKYALTPKEVKDILKY